MRLDPTDIAGRISRRGRLTARQYIDGVLNRDRMVLARAITLVESGLAPDQELAAQVLDGILPHTGKSRRAGITGVPGAGKSTFIDTLGMHLIRERGERVAVLSVDPSSPISGGSILGDKTRMERLSVEDAAFIRPSPARGHPGGVARHTRETLLLCEAAGFDNVLVETVGVGQSETAVRSMTDFFLLLMIPGAGDELQGIKRGILEMVDAVAVNKADGDNKPRAHRARAEYAAALRLFPAASGGWRPPVLTCSALTGEGVPRVWEIALEHRRHMEECGLLAVRRSTQALDWLHELIALGLRDRFRADPAVGRRLPEIEAAVRESRATAFGAARELLELFQKKKEL